jgi:hypothetical protein
MKFLENLFDPIAERAKSPFISSFVISWLLWNWRFLILLFWPSKIVYGNAEQLLGWVANTVTFWSGLTYPLLSSAAYILIYPWLNRQIIKFTEEQKLITQNKQLEIIGRLGVTGKRFIDMRERFIKEQTKNIQSDEEILRLTGEIENWKDSLKQQSQRNMSLEEEHRNIMVDTRTVLEDQINALNNDSAVLKKKLSNLENRHHCSSFFDGRWDYVRKINNRSQTQKKHLYIKGEKYNSVGAGGDITPSFDIQNIDFDIDNRQFDFVLIKIGNNPNDEKVVCANLRITGRDILEGFENGHAVTYTRVK